MAERVGQHDALGGGAAWLCCRLGWRGGLAMAWCGDVVCVCGEEQRGGCRCCCYCVVHVCSVCMHVYMWCGDLRVKQGRGGGEFGFGFLVKVNGEAWVLAGVERSEASMVV